MTETAPEEKPVRRRERRSWLSAVPLLVIPLLAYVAFAGAGADFDIPRFSIPLPSGGVWQLGLGPILLAVSLPNPRVRNPARPTRRLLAIAGAVNARMPIIAHRASCLLPAR